MQARLYGHTERRFGGPVHILHLLAPKVQRKTTAFRAQPVRAGVVQLAIVKDVRCDLSLHPHAHPVFVHLRFHHCSPMLSIYNIGKQEVFLRFQGSNDSALTLSIHAVLKRFYSFWTGSQKISYLMLQVW